MHVEGGGVVEKGVDGFKIKIQTTQKREYEDKKDEIKKNVEENVRTNISSYMFFEVFITKKDKDL